MRIKQGSLINVLADNTPVTSDPKPGDGATICKYTDRTAATVTRVRRTTSGLLVVDVQVDKAIRTDSHGISESQSYRYEPDPNGATYRFSQRKDGVLREVGGSWSLLLGTRMQYHDYSF